MVSNLPLACTALDAWVNLVRLHGTTIEFETLLTQSNQIGQDTPRHPTPPFRAEHRRTAFNMSHSPLWTHHNICHGQHLRRSPVKSLRTTPCLSTELYEPQRTLRYFFR